MVRYAKFRFTEVNDALVRPRLPTLDQPTQLYTFRPRAGSRVARHRDPTGVRRRRCRSTAPPLAICGFFEDIRRTNSGLSASRHLASTSSSIRCRSMNPSPTSSPDSRCGLSIFKCFLNPHADHGRERGEGFDLPGVGSTQRRFSQARGRRPHPVNDRSPDPSRFCDVPDTPPAWRPRSPSA